MKVVFIASQAQSVELAGYYKQINDALESKGMTVFSGHLFTNENDSDLVDKKQIEAWYKEVIQHVRAADTIFVEISYPSTVNVGHILTYALDTGKPVVALYRSGREPFFLRGRVDDKLVLLEYSDKDINEVVSNALEYVSSAQDVRFNFFISPEIGRFLDWISKKKRLPRAVYLRKLIEEDMKANKEYSESSNE